MNCRNCGADPHHQGGILPEDSGMDAWDCGTYRVHCSGNTYESELCTTRRALAEMTAEKEKSSRRAEAAEGALHLIERELQSAHCEADLGSYVEAAIERAQKIYNDWERGGK